jgi:hypothetical protein
MEHNNFMSRYRLSRLLFSVSLVTALNGAAHAIPSQWEVIQLPQYTLNPAIATAYDINNKNEVVGGAYYTNAINEWSEIGFYWRPGTNIQWCPLPTANYNSRIINISENGLAVGTADPKNIPGWTLNKPLTWRPSVSAQLLNPFSSPGDYSGNAAGVTSSGTIVGRSGGKAYRATANGNGVQILASNGISSLVEINDVNDAGVVCGEEYLNNEYRAIYTANNTAFRLPRPNPNGDGALWQNNGYGINSLNSITGEAYMGDNSANDLGYIYRQGKGYYYYGLGSGDDKLISAINNQDYAVGQGVLDASELLVPTATSYTRVSIMSRIDPATPVFHDLKLTGINDNFWMCGNVLDYAVVLRPVSYVTGKVTLQDYPAGPLAQQVIIQFVDPLENTVMEEYGALLDAQGNYSVKTRNPGAIRIRVKASHWLSRSLIMDFSNNVSGLNFSLINGDVDGDNEVTILDYLVVSKYYEKTSEMSDWKSPDSDGIAPQDADVDGDGEISILDYLIVSGNYEKAGE